MDLEPSIVFVATGGAIAGHDETTFARFAAAAARSRHARRLCVLGWVSSAQAEAVARRADLGVVVERRLYERRLGSENRVVHWMAHGVPSVTTAQSELGAGLVALGLAAACNVGDAASLADALVAAARDRGGVRAMGDACRAHCAEHFNYDRTAAPLVDWCAAPVHARDHGERRTVSIGLFSEPKALVSLLESYLDELHVGQIAFRSARWLSRRALRGMRRSGGEATRPVE
jgi:hypothetical protein